MEDLSPGQLRVLQQAKEMEIFRNPVDPSAPWALQAKWAQRAGLIGIRLIDKTKANVVVTPKGDAILNKLKETVK